MRSNIFTTCTVVVYVPVYAFIYIYLLLLLVSTHVMHVVEKRTKATDMFRVITFYSNSKNSTAYVLSVIQKV